MPGLIEANALELGLSGTSLLLLTVSEQPIAQHEREVMKTLVPTVNRLLRFFSIPQTINLPGDITELKRYTHSLLDDASFSTECLETIRLHHGSSTSQFYRLGEFVAWYALGHGKAPAEIQDQMRRAIRETGKGLELSSESIEQILSSPANLDVHQLLDTKAGKVFIVHGRNHMVRDALDLFVRDLGLRTCVMDAAAHLGRTLPEKFESLASECAFAVFVLTADDTLTNAEGRTIRRARQNVVLEIGYFWGKLGRDSRVAFLVENADGMELPTDIQGIGWIPITSDLAETKLRLRREFVEAGLLK